MKKYTLVLVVFFFFSFQMHAQRNCGTMSYMSHLESMDPSVSLKMAQNEVAIRNWIKSHGSEQQKSIITIPVVVHVLYRVSVQNISDAQIQSQIDILNEDYRRLNTDTANTPPLFDSLAADVGIEFCFAHQDPSGNWTDGVTRTFTSKISFDLTQNDAKYTAQGGHDAWDRDKYFNIWVVPQIKDGATGGILGYSQFPGGPAATDGVVIGYRYFGSTGTAAAPFNKGRTLTHELGHWLNLYHIWGDDNGSCAGSDQVQDTPNQASENYGCPNFPHSSCSNTSDMFMNYMDYTDDVCMNMFSEGQKQRMLAVMNTSRLSLVTSGVCEPLALREISNADQLKVYPNPSNGEFVLDFNNLEIKGSVTVKVYNAMGQLVFEREYIDIANQESIRLSEVNSGMYMIHIISDQFSIIKKIEIQR